VKHWIKILLLIFIVWLLDQAGWLNSLLIFFAWTFFLLLIIFVASLIVRPGFFRILKESVKEVKDAEAREKQMQALQHQFTHAAQQASEGKPDELLHLAEKHNLGDAWFTLATILAKSDSTSADQNLATGYFQKGAQAKLWIQSNLDTCLLEWERRQFFGIGCVVNHVDLATSWEKHHFSGYQREIELAWICVNIKDTKNDFEKAWFWLMLGKARWGDDLKPTLLPDELYADLYNRLEKSLSNKCRLKLEESAKDRAYQEFVSSR
jgi:hypothetical protein